jgi:hypothetical protein
MNINWTRFNAGIVCLLSGIASYVDVIDYWMSYVLVGIASLAVLCDWMKQRHIIE